VAAGSGEAAAEAVAGAVAGQPQMGDVGSFDSGCGWPWQRWGGKLLPLHTECQAGIHPGTPLQCRHTCCNPTTVEGSLKKNCCGVSLLCRVFAGAVADGGIVKGIRVPDGQKISNSRIKPKGDIASELAFACCRACCACC
jgi:hypothetical protein